MADEKTQLDDIKRGLLNKRWIAFLVLFVIIVIGIGAFTNAITKIKTFVVDLAPAAEPGPNNEDSTETTGDESLFFKGPDSAQQTTIAQGENVEVKVPGETQPPMDQADRHTADGKDNASKNNNLSPEGNTNTQPADAANKTEAKAESLKPETHRREWLVREKTCAEVLDKLRNTLDHQMRDVKFKSLFVGKWVRWTGKLKFDPSSKLLIAEENDTNAEFEFWVDTFDSNLRVGDIVVVEGKIESYTLRDLLAFVQLNGATIVDHAIAE